MLGKEKLEDALVITNKRYWYCSARKAKPIDLAGSVHSKFRQLRRGCSIWLLSIWRNTILEIECTADSEHLQFVPLRVLRYV